jgi:hypothetical protein
MNFKIKGMLIRSAVIAALGGFLFGFDTAVISGAEGTLSEFFNQNYTSLSQIFGTVNFWHGFTVASALIGTILGALIFGKHLLICLVGGRCYLYWVHYISFQLLAVRWHSTGYFL